MKVIPQFWCYWCKRQLKMGEKLLDIGGNFYCKTCPQFSKVSNQLKNNMEVI